MNISLRGAAILQSAAAVRVLMVQTAALKESRGSSDVPYVETEVTKLDLTDVKSAWQKKKELGGLTRQGRPFTH